ncbi:MAG: hypothetical protein CO186_12935 [Zetaproteobacteria bacterium CG_4_9_14_3_um_filter_49_83]|nr:MAG: hypothetical protein AUJ56_03095 [Zetaproteobacteria bacterium CG1_02_49_23]PIQ33185.1 MAG: hypothetical protein COW62_06180 [Zetaproteobacteria bacterium CG17_big_fil_post_rev_8_21_14_2_50_50_13]PIV29389.1 MAG: hypothetical protein COS35_12520 [Zetaproteobacteria bacterium CG02_land_8_20_14_3_00_50_9]PIY54823.1 MAG: hypothetical protein COZ00_12910 [Zetaproteobacteria bacterium CG_4_10_14_0_8_um_filter_49_80]PJA33690.1 MAG: hypothetical protein CO186_12935 [Zetaproteobacteria bacterium
MRKLTLTVLLLVCSALFYVASFQKMPLADDLADRYFTESIQAASLAYATTRGVNAVVSVIKESELDLAPAGVGVTIAVGQVLDPIDDMTERLSSLLVAAIASLGIQKIGFEVSAIVSFKAIALLLGLAVPLLWLYQPVSVLLLQWLIKAAFVLLLLRFMLPVSALVSDTLYQHWLQPEVTAALQKLDVVSRSYREVSTLPATQSSGFFSSLTDAAADKIERTRQLFLKTLDHVDSIISALLSLMTAYLAIFVVQVVLLPVFMLWLLVGIFRSKVLDQLSGDIAAIGMRTN